VTPQPTAGSGHRPAGAAPQAALSTEAVSALARFPTFNHVVELIRVNRDGKLLADVETDLRLVSYQPGRIEFEPTERAPRDLAQRLGQRLQLWTGNRWAVIIVSEGGGDTIDEVRNAERHALEAVAREHPLMQAVLSQFPKAIITEIRTPDQIAALAETEALPEVEDEWDPFEED
jgi:DNA polymerase-3 subunit gamma/tau